MDKPALIFHSVPAPGVPVLRLLVSRSLRYCAAMSPALPTICRSCGNSYLIHRHDVSVHNRGSLPCPHCRAKLVAWFGPYFYTLAVSPPSSQHDMPVIDDSGSR
ncbi:MAG TPA: hypothetical protein VM165_19435 [Planctomycetaceae bacterium]|nr:hypothetical protein [Planctomycetaceae bacterium]